MADRLAPQGVQALRGVRIDLVAQAQLAAGAVPPAVHLPSASQQARVAQAHSHLCSATPGLIRSILIWLSLPDLAYQ